MRMNPYICFAERLEKLLQRLKNVESKINGLFSGGQPLAAQASALYPELNALRRWHPIFSEAAQQGIISRAWQMYRAEHCAICSEPSHILAVKCECVG